MSCLATKECTDVAVQADSEVRGSNPVGIVLDCTCTWSTRASEVHGVPVRVKRAYMYCTRSTIR